MPKQALYLKWRPRAFDDVIGQEHVTRTLRNSIESGRIRHAYLFSGPRGTGKTTTARLLAAALGSKNLDLIEIDAASHTGVDDVRDLRDKIAFMPSEGQYKVYIIDEVHRFSGSAFDALLKTLEEPPPHAIFVLATTEIDKVPDTIKSRCLQFEFRRVALKEVADHLQQIAKAESINIDREALELIARHGTGSVRDSISLLDQIVADPHEHITLELTQRILGTASSEAVEALCAALFAGDVVAGLHIINQAIDAGSDPRQFCQQVLEHLRFVLLAQTSSADLIEAPQEKRAVFAQQAGMVSRTKVLFAIRAFNSALADQQAGWQPQLALELAFVESIGESSGRGADHVSASLPMDSISDIENLVEALVNERFSALVNSGAGVAQMSRAAQPKQVDEPEPQIEHGKPPVVALSQIQEKWVETRRAVKTKNKILEALLDHVEVRSVSGEVVTLAVKNDVFLERLNTTDHRSLLNYVLQRLHGHPLKVRVVMQGDDTTSTSSKAHADDPIVAAGLELGAEIHDYDDK